MFRVFFLIFTFSALSQSCANPPTLPNMRKNLDSNRGNPFDPGPGALPGPTIPPPQVSVNKELADEIVALTSTKCENPSPSKSRPTLRLLTRLEYRNTVKEVLGLSKDYSEDLSPEQKSLGFRNNSDINVIGDNQMKNYINVARAIAKDALSNNSSSLPCRSGDTCAQTLLDTLAARAWRRPLAANEKTGLLNLYKMAAADGPAMGLEVMLTALLASPEFLYRSEIGKDGKLTSWELASALSFFFWASPPDEALIKLAESGDILKEDVLTAQANRLIMDGKAKDGISELSGAYLKHSSILGVSKNAAKYPEYKPELRSAMEAEAKDSFDYWIRSKSFGFKDLFTADVTVGSSTLAEFYQAAPMQDGMTNLINFASSKRRGILGFASILGSLATNEETHPINRGLFIREQILCESMPPTPPGLAVSVPEVKPGLSTRERFAAHTASPQCASCHSLIDGVGFGMEDYDAVGRLREKDENRLVDASGSIIGLEGKDVTFSGVAGMNDVLKNSERAKRCFVLQTFRQAAGRLEAEGDLCAIRAVADDFVKNDLPIAKLLVKIITSPFTSNRGI